MGQNGTPQCLPPVKSDRTPQGHGQSKSWDMAINKSVQILIVFSSLYGQWSGSRFPSSLAFCLTKPIRLSVQGTEIIVDDMEGRENAPSISVEV